MKASKSFDVALLFRALADHTRLRLLNLMGDDEVCVCFLVEALGVTQPKISRHLAYLRRAGIVAARREGKWMHYRLVPPPSHASAAILEQTLNALRNDEKFENDHERLKLACCQPTRLISLRSAPLPLHLNP